MNRLPGDRTVIEISSATAIGDIVACDLRSAAVFARYGIDFCCGGGRSLGDVCREQGLDLQAVARELCEAAAIEGSADTTGWPLDRVMNHIVTKHHTYVRAQIPVIQGYTAKLAAKHGQRLPAIAQIAQVFDALAGELRWHMDKEEGILFPYIDAMRAAKDTCSRVARTPFGTIQNPIRMMELEHQEAADHLLQLRALTNDFQPPADACATWRACYAALADFERDVHEHVRLENHVLFPAATRLEEELN
jgi:regulator of cell morphogenesis and NO signaling